MLITLRCGKELFWFPGSFFLYAFISSVIRGTFPAFLSGLFACVPSGALLLYILVLLLPRAFLL